MKVIFRSLSLFILACLAILGSGQVNIEQLMFGDLRYVNFLNPANRSLGIGIIALSICLLTNFMNFIFRPFIEIYLMYYYKFSFYLLINLVSISTVLILLRVYGYSRFMILLYIFISSTVFYLEEKIF